MWFITSKERLYNKENSIVLLINSGFWKLNKYKYANGGGRVVVYAQFENGPWFQLVSTKASYAYLRE